MREGTDPNQADHTMKNGSLGTIKLDEIYVKSGIEKFFTGRIFAATWKSWERRWK